MSNPQSREAVRRHILRHFIETGRAPSFAEIAAALGCTLQEARGACAALAGAKAIALHPSGEGIRMAHPFSAVQTPYPVEAGGVSYWANCAWDALGIAAVTGKDTHAAARCPDCGGEVDLSVRGGKVADPIVVIHFTVPPLEFWDNIGFT